jgi:electron-transferring-flavoprotein dehydrogenase
MLDYWVDLMDFEPEEIPREVILRDLDGADFIGPTESLAIDDTGLDSSYPSFGFAFHRARFDDWLREEAEAAGATYRVGDSVTGVDTDPSNDGSGPPVHTLTLADGEEIGADHLILADGPQRTVTGRVLDGFLDGTFGDRLPSRKVNHIAYQEHRRLPADLFEPGRLKFWWGVMPGHTAYPWVFPNDDTVARIGLTMPIGLDVDDFDRSEWALLRPDDESIPDGAEYVRRLLDLAYPGRDPEEFPLVEDRGKSGGTETYPISSTRPIESPTAANVAVVGGAMGATSAFHEGGDHVAVRTGKIAGELAAADRLERYNDAWQAALGPEILRNVTMADIVREYGPADWDHAFKTADRLLHRGEYSLLSLLRSGLSGIRLVRTYRKTKGRFDDGRYVQLREEEYAV